MKKRLLIDCHDAVVAGFHTGDFTEADNLEKLNGQVKREFFAGLVIGAYDAVVVRSGRYSAHVFTRSARAGVPVQETMLCKLPSGEWVMNCHHDMKTGDDAEVGPGRVYIFEAGEDVPELDEMVACQEDETMKRYHVTYWSGENLAGETVVKAWTLEGAMKKAKEKKAIYGADRVAVRHGAECKVSSC